MRPRLVLAIAGAGLFLLPLSAPTAVADVASFRLPADQLDQPTGLAADHATDTYWVSNRTGGQGRLLGLSSSGKLTATVGFRAQTRSLEAVAYHDHVVYVADVGDPDGNRATVAVYFFENLEPKTGVIQYHSWDFSYPDGAHDAKAMLVDSTGRLYLITTGDRPGIYAAPDTPTRLGMNHLTRVGNAPAGVTDAVALDARRWAVRTASSVEIIGADSHKVTASAALPVSTGDLLGNQLGGGGKLLAAGSGSTAEVFSVTPPTTLAGPRATTSGRPTASTAQTAAPGQPADNQPDESADTGQSRRTGTWVAIGLAALLAVLAGVLVVVEPWRNRPDVEGAEPRTNRIRPKKPASPPGQTRVKMERPATPASPATPSFGQPLPATRPGAPQPAPGESVTSPGAGGISDEEWLAGEPDTSPASQRMRLPGDIEDDDDISPAHPDTDDTILRSQLPGRRFGQDATSHWDEHHGTGHLAREPSRGLGYDPNLWGEDNLRRHEPQPPD